MTNLHRAQDSARVTLKVGPRHATFLAWLDKFFHLLANWLGYRTPLALAVLPSVRVSSSRIRKRRRGPRAGRCVELRAHLHAVGIRDSPFPPTSATNGAARRVRSVE
jgi:hypothetical protein